MFCDMLLIKQTPNLLGTSFAAKGHRSMQQGVTSVQIQPTRGMILWWRRIPSRQGLWDHWLWTLLLLSIVSHLLKQLWCLPKTCTVVCDFIWYVCVISWLHHNLMGTYTYGWSGRWLPNNCIILIYRKYTRICCIALLCHEDCKTLKEPALSLLLRLHEQTLAPQSKTNCTQVAHFYLKTSSN